ncbi:MAG: hypothetical protein ACK59M_18550 [Pseudomonadota bacterium]|jgi:hypothetical protein
MHVQNRPDLYEDRHRRPPAAGAVLVPEGVYEAVLVDVQPFDGAHGRRVGMVYEITDGEPVGKRLMESASISGRGKLAELVAGMSEIVGLSEDGLRGLIGTRCRVRVVHGRTRAGTLYASITQTFRTR